MSSAIGSGGESILAAEYDETNPVVIVSHKSQ